jgi:hypothetical protein
MARPELQAASDEYVRTQRKEESRDEREVRGVEKVE